MIVGPRSQSAVATLVDRRTRYLRLVALPDGHSADQLRDALIAAFGALPGSSPQDPDLGPGLRDGPAPRARAVLRRRIFFARPGSPWQRGTNENTNGLVRQYLPKRTNLSLHTADDLRAIEDRLNNRPRKTLGWHPAHAFAAALAP